jgi:hypothetical protein
MRVWALIAAMLMSGSAMAQSADIRELREATREMSFLSYFFGSLAQGATEEEIADNYRAMDASTQTFLRVAAEPYRGRALRAAQAVFRAAKLPAPAVLPSAVVEAERRRDPVLTERLCSSLARVFGQAGTHMEGDAELGPTQEAR